MTASSALAGAADPHPGDAVLEAVHLQKRFPVRNANPLAPSAHVHAVEDASFTLYRGKAVALVGESGSGKTTIARMLARIYEPTSGSILFNGAPVKLGEGSGDAHTYQRQVQMVFQDPFASLNPVHDIHYHLARPLKRFGHAHGRRAVNDAVLALLHRVSLTPAEQFAHRYPHELSGGQRQRIAIARALAVQPSVLLADEPVSMLDVSIRLDILNLLLALKSDRLALLYITHDIASARYFADETHVLYAGQMVEGGASDAVIQEPKHPYTQLLISAAPDPDRIIDDAHAGEFASMPARGEIPSLVNPPTGCRFHPRCPHAMPVCKERFPGRTDLGGGRWVNCFLYGDGNAHAATNGDSPHGRPATA